MKGEHPVAAKTYLSNNQKHVATDLLAALAATIVSAPPDLQAQRFRQLEPKAKDAQSSLYLEHQAAAGRKDAFVWGDSLNGLGDHAYAEQREAYQFLPDPILKSDMRIFGKRLAASDPSAALSTQNTLSHPRTGFFAGITVRFQQAGGADVPGCRSAEAVIKHDLDAPGICSALAEQIHLLEQQRSPLEAQIRPLEDQARPIEDEVYFLEKQMESSEARIRRLNKLVPPPKIEIDSLENEVSGFAEQLKPLESKLEPFVKQLQPLKEQLAGLNKKIDALELQRDSAKVLSPEVMITFPGSEDSVHVPAGCSQRLRSFFNARHRAKNCELGAVLVRQMEAHLERLNESRVKAGLPLCKLKVVGNYGGGRTAAFAVLSAKNPASIETVLLNPLRLSSAMRAQFSEENFNAANRSCTTIWKEDNWAAADAKNISRSVGTVIWQHASQA